MMVFEKNKTLGLLWLIINFKLIMKKSYPFKENFNNGIDFTDLKIDCIEVKEDTTKNF